MISTIKKPKYLLIVYILFFLIMVLFFEKHLYHRLNGSDINFDLLIFLSKNIFADPFETELFTFNRGFTSVVGNLYTSIFGKPENYSSLYKIYLITNLIPLFLLTIYIALDKNDNILKNFLLFILLCWISGQLAKQLTLFPMKMSAVLFFLYYSYLIKFTNLLKNKIKISIISFISVFMYPHVLPALVLVTVIFKIKKIQEWSILILINIPAILFAISIFIYQYNGKETYQAYSPMYGQHDFHMIIWYTYHVIKKILTPITIISLLSISFLFTYLLKDNIDKINQFKKICNFLFKISLSVYFLYVILTLIKNFDINLPFIQYLEYFAVPIGLMWSTLYISIFINKHLDSIKISQLVFAKYIFFIIFTFNIFILIKSAQYSIKEENDILIIEQKIKKNLAKFNNINCYKKINKLNQVHLRLLTNINNLRPFNVTFQNPYSKLDLPEYVKYVRGYTPDNVITDLQIPNNNPEECIK